ncbi:hypothetical protein J2O08_16555 [Elizabethkingia anophelis]|uniref:DUF6660 family protein n=1 Tax=Elizabethkingia anophelis TaxID=1117645 RepID=UPI0020B21E15|nr:DUF6660 family protein [Elizabethkingia anophelis]MDV3956682.1 hypothetical protein [Elizabethkingia anophelis]UTF92788.1 hypothetical protein J2O08_16555 [Elizabethkingia anophelis]
MKHLGLILAVFFTFLLTVSCSDASVYTGNTQTTVQKDSHSQDDHHSDLCSPFCTCSCCGMHITATNFAVLSISTVSPVYYDKIVSSPVMSAFDITYGIWQPPKI